MVRWCIRLTHLTLVCEVIKYRLVQVRQNQKKTFRVGGPQSPFSISSSFILSFVLLPFFLNTKNYSRVGSRRTLCRRTLRLENPQNLRTAQAGIFRLRTNFFLEYIHTRTMRRSRLSRHRQRVSFASTLLQQRSLHRAMSRFL